MALVIASLLLYDIELRHFLDLWPAPVPQAFPQPDKASRLDGQPARHSLANGLPLRLAAPIPQAFPQPETKTPA